MTHAIVVMGVSGCGKTTVGQALAEALNCKFYDGDDFHPPENIAKMSRGIPLNDRDRRPWLERLRDLIAEHIKRDESIVIACSALKKRYRTLLREGNTGLKFLYLEGRFDLIWERIQSREEHYMKASMLQSQFDALETPLADEAITINVKDSLPEIIERTLPLIGIYHTD